MCSSVSLPCRYAACCIHFNIYNMREVEVENYTLIWLVVN